MVQNFITSFEPLELKSMIREALREELTPILSTLQKPAEPEKGYLSRHETAKRLKISLGTLHSRTVSNEIPSHRIGRRILYKPDEVEACLQKRNFRAWGGGKR